MPAKQLLQEREPDRKFRLLFEENPQPMWVFDPETDRFLESNAAASDLSGYTPQEFRRLKVSELDAAEEGRPGSLSRTRESTRAAYRHRTKDGQIIDVEVAVHDIHHEGRTVRLAVIMDITGRLRLEEQLRQAQKMEAVGMLAGGVAHDFNNLLTIINGYSQLILNTIGPNDPNRHSAEQIMKAGERAAALTKQLLAFSRRQVLQPKIIDLNKLVTSLSGMLQRLIGEDIDLRLSLNPELGRVNADPGQLEQVIMNLVVNGRDAMPKGGVLTVETSNVTLDENYAGRHITAPPGSYILLSVSDNGSGMDEATRARLFEPFFTTKSSGKGTGLGLSTVFGIVKQSGGSLDVHSEPGCGTSVEVYLPRVEEAAVSHEGESQPHAVAPGSETILLVEDDEMVRTLVKETLERSGYKILEAPNPIDARRMSEEFHEPIHLMITDVVMPKISGRQLAEQLVQQRPDMKVLYMSGYTDTAVLKSGLLKKDVAFLQKPFTPGALTQKVREVLESAQGKTLPAIEH